MVLSAPSSCCLRHLQQTPMMAHMLVHIQTESAAWAPYANAKPTPTPMRNYEMILCAKEGKTPFMMHTNRVVDRLKTEYTDPKELKKKIKEYESEAWEDFLDMTIQGATNWAAHNVDPLEKAMELQLSDSVFIGSHACSCGAWCCGPEDLMPAAIQGCLPCPAQLYDHREGSIHSGLWGRGMCP